MRSNPSEPGEGNSTSRQSFASQDRDFIALVDGAFATAAARSGPHLLCRPGCSQCCVGVFAISPADAHRLELGVRRLEKSDPDRAIALRARASASWARLAPAFPGDPATGRLALDPNSGSLQPSAAFEDFGNDETCPVLNPENGTCELYDFRPHTCRVFGPPVAITGGYGACELCFTQATSDRIVAAAIPEEAEATPQSLDEAAVAAGAPSGLTIVCDQVTPKDGISL
jgi:Fe-S-cluster containining protein